MLQLLDEFGVGGQHRIVGSVGLPDLQGGDGPGHVLDQEDLEPVKVGTRSLEVVIVPDVLVGLLLLPAAILEDEGAGADHILRAAVGVLLGQLAGHVLRVHLHVVGGEVDHEGGRGELDGHPHRPFVDHLGRLVLVEIAQAVGAAAERVGKGDAIQAVDDVAGLHRLAVGPVRFGQVEGVHRAVLADVPALGQVPDDLLRVDRVVLNQLVEPGAGGCECGGQAGAVVHVPEAGVVASNPLHGPTVLATSDPVGFRSLNFHRLYRGCRFGRRRGTTGRRCRLGRSCGSGGLGRLGRTSGWHGGGRRLRPYSRAGGSRRGVRFGCGCRSAAGDHECQRERNSDQDQGSRGRFAASFHDANLRLRCARQPAK